MVLSGEVQRNQLKLQELWFSQLGPVGYHSRYHCKISWKQYYLQVFLCHPAKAQLIWANLHVVSDQTCLHHQFFQIHVEFMRSVQILNMLWYCLGSLECLSYPEECSASNVPPMSVHKFSTNPLYFCLIVPPPYPPSIDIAVPWTNLTLLCKLLLIWAYMLRLHLFVVKFWNIRGW